MPVSVQCPACGRSYHIRDELVGKKVRCDCGSIIDIQRPDSAAGRPPMATPVSGHLPRPPVARPAGPRSSFGDDSGYEVEAPTFVPGRGRVAAAQRRDDDEDTDEDDQPSKNFLDTLPGAKWLIVGPIVIAVLVVVLRFTLPMAVQTVREVQVAIQDEAKATPAAAGTAPATATVSDEGEAADDGPPPAAPVLAKSPYGLTSPSERMVPGAPAPLVQSSDPLSFQPRADGLLATEVLLPIAAGTPGSNSRLHVVKPADEDSAKKRGCILVAPAGGSLMRGPVSGSDDATAELAAYAKAGYVVVGFHQDGEVPSATPTADELATASAQFFAAQAGLVNARNALEFVLARLDNVDPSRIYIAGRNSGGTLALLFAEHEPRVRACVAFGPTTNVVKHVEWQALQTGAPPTAAELLLAQQTSPATHAAKLSCPTLLVALPGDVGAVAAELTGFEQQLKTLHKEVTLATVNTASASSSDDALGIEPAIAWLEALEPSNSGKRTPKSPALAPGDTAGQPRSPLPAFGAEEPAIDQYRQRAVNASRLHRTKEANSLLLADVLSASDEDFLGRVRWSPSLGRPVAQLHWGFGAEMVGGTGGRPSNLQAPGVMPRRDRTEAAEMELSQNLQKATGEIGVWLAEGLKNRVDAGTFGDWVVEAPREKMEHRGIALLEFASPEQMLKEARTRHVDVMVVHLIDGRALSMIVQLYDVAKGDMIWESKSISNSKLQTARRQNKNLAADFAGEVLDVIDKKIALHDLPKLSPKLVQERLKAIRLRSVPDELAALVELRYYQLAGLITREQAEAEVAELLSADGATAFCSDDAEARSKLVESLVPSR